MAGEQLELAPGAWPVRLRPCQLSNSKVVYTHILRICGQKSLYQHCVHSRVNLQQSSEQVRAIVHVDTCVVQDVIRMRSNLRRTRLATASPSGSIFPLMREILLESHGTFPLILTRANLCIVIS